MLHKGAISSACNLLSEFAFDESKDFSNALEEIYKLVAKLQKRRQPGSVVNNVFVIGDPVVVKFKGALKKKKCAKGMRVCSHCRNVGHAIQRCPLLFAPNGGEQEEHSESSVELDDDSNLDDDNIPKKVIFLLNLNVKVVMFS